MNVNQFIKELKKLNPELRKKEIIIFAPNGIEFEPKIKRNFIAGFFPFDGRDKIKNIAVTYE